MDRVRASFYAALLLPAAPLVRTAFAVDARWPPHGVRMSQPSQRFAERDCVPKPGTCTLFSMEPWLRGTHTDLPAVVRAVVHALELSREDIEHWCQPLSDEALNERAAANPDPLAPVAFHIRHIVRTLDRLLTYAEGRPLSSEQLVALKTELDPGATNAELFSEFRKGIDDAMGRLRAFAGADLEQPAPSDAKDCRRPWAACWSTAPTTRSATPDRPSPRQRLFRKR